MSENKTAVEEKLLDSQREALLNEIVGLVKENISVIMRDDGYFGEVGVKFADASPHTIFVGRTYRVVNGHVVKP